MAIFYLQKHEFELSAIFCALSRATRVTLVYLRVADRRRRAIQIYRLKNKKSNDFYYRMILE